MQSTEGGVDWRLKPPLFPNLESLQERTPEGFERREENSL